MKTRILFANFGLFVSAFVLMGVSGCEPKVVGKGYADSRATNDDGTPPTTAQIKAAAIAAATDDRDRQKPFASCGLSAPSSWTDATPSATCGTTTTLYACFGTQEWVVKCGDGSTKTETTDTQGVANSADSSCSESQTEGQNAIQISVEEDVCGDGTTLVSQTWTQAPNNPNDGSPNPTPSPTGGVLVTYCNATALSTGNCP